MDEYINRFKVAVEEHKIALQNVEQLDIEIHRANCELSLKLDALYKARKELLKAEAGEL